MLPVDGLEIEVAKRDTDGGASETLSSGDRESETRGEEDSDGGTQFHAESTGGRDLGDLVAESAYNVVSVEPETDTEKKTSDDEDPDGSVGFLSDDTSGVGVVRTNPGSDSVGNCDVRLADASRWKMQEFDLPSLEPWAIDIIMAEAT